MSEPDFDIRMAFVVSPARDSRQERTDLGGYLARHIVDREMPRFLHV
jgi:hypothetical protein